MQIAISNALKYANSTNAYRWYLCHDDGLLNAVQTTLTTNSAGNYLRNVSAASGLASAGTHPLTSSGWLLPEAFLNDIRDNGQGIVLIEARAKTTKPLRLELRQLKNGFEELIGKRELPLSITGVEEMFRHKNLRPDPSVASRTSASNELPSNGKNFVFVHGYSVSESAAQGWHAEMFKRLYWSGSNARFYGVTWQGDQSQISIPILGNVTPRYHINVVNALDAAPGLKTWLTGPSGPGGNTIIAGHSLGNMLVGSAIDGVAGMTSWFMIDGAVAIENFDGSVGAQSTNMIHPDWLAYSNRLWCSEWYKLFVGTGDNRQKLTWRDVFTNSVSKTYNFYSSGEEVLETHEGDPGFWDYTSGSDAWCLQEKRKGRNWFSSIGGSTHGGWGFSGEYDRDDYKGFNHTLLSDAQLCRQPFFDVGGGYCRNLCDPYNGSNYAATNRNVLLAGFIPSRTLPCGANEVTKFNPPFQPPRNFNMNTPAFQDNGWPTGRTGGDWGNRWLHSDVREISYLYVHEVFDKFATEGGLE